MVGKGDADRGRFKHLQHFAGQLAIFFCDLHNRFRSAGFVIEGFPVSNRRIALRRES
jgi:hypothetical protein